MLQRVWDAMVGMDYISIAVGFVIGCAITWLAAWDHYEGADSDIEGAEQEDVT